MIWWMLSEAGETTHVRVCAKVELKAGDQAARQPPRGWRGGYTLLRRIYDELPIGTGGAETACSNSTAAQALGLETLMLHG